MIYLDTDDLIHIARRVIGNDVAFRDLGLLSAAAARPQATVGGDDAYPDLTTKCAALIESIVRNHALIDGNKRLGLAAAIVFLGINGSALTASNDEAYRFIVSVADGSARGVLDIAIGLRRLIT